MSSSFGVLLIALFCLGVLWTKAPAAAASIDNSTVPPKTIKEIEKELESLVTYVTKMALPYFVRNSDLKLSSSCMSTFIKMFVDIRKLKLPAIKLLDAMAKPPFGLLRGTFAIMGDYDECLEVSATKRGQVPTSKDEEYYHGQYCTIELNFPPSILKGMVDYANGQANLTDFGKLGSFINEFPAVNFAGGYFKYHIGICLPSTCSIEDLEAIIALVPVSFIPLNVLRCEGNSKKQLNSEQLVFLIVLTVIAVFVLIGTLVDAFLYIKLSSYDGHHKDRFLQFLVAFSIYTNTKKFLQASKNPSAEITCINGMYVLGTLLVVIYHTYFLPFFLTFSSNGSNLGHYLKDPNFTLVVTMGISIEAYFLFSGLFLVYPRFKSSEGKVNVNFFKIIVRRYIRLCPSLLLILGVIVLLPLIGNGPVWADIFEKAAENTRKWWWTYALMFNNFLAIKDQNFLYLWFIPCLMQISILGAALTWVMARWPRLGIAATAMTGLACNIALGIMTATRGYPPSYAIYYYHSREKFEEPIYTAPLSHVGSFGIGMLLGYYMAKTPALKWSRIHVILGWIGAFLCTVGVQYVLYAGHEGKDPDPILAALYAATHKTIFSMGLAWIILACTHGYGGVLGDILSWKGFGPLSKLGYFGYLVHYIVISFHVSMARSPIPFSHYENWIRIFSYTSVTFLVAYILYVTFEMPLTFIESLFLPTRPPTDRQRETLRQSNPDLPTLKLQNAIIANSNFPKQILNGIQSERDEFSKL